MKTYNDMVAPYLCHHGIKGQKWGVRRYRNRDGTLTDAGRRRYASDRATLKGARTQNLDKWGMSPETNVLYLTGLSGSGKSTVAEKLKAKDTDVIHLDFYLEKGNSKETAKYQSREFNRFMEKRGVPYKDLTNGKYTDRSKEKWALIDKLAESIHEYGKEQYRRGKRVIAEGVQIADQTLYPDEMKGFYKGRPMAVMNTSLLRSMYQGNKRDGISPFDISGNWQRLKNQRMWSKNLKALSRYA